MRGEILDSLESLSAGAYSLIDTLEGTANSSKPRSMRKMRLLHLPERVYLVPPKSCP